MAPPGGISSPLPILAAGCEKTAEEKGFRYVFFGVPSIGGRYSVLSNFGMVPLAASGHDVQAFLDAARVMARACGPDVAACAKSGRHSRPDYRCSCSARARQAHDHSLAVTRFVRRLGRAIDRRVDRQEWQGHHSFRRRTAWRQLQFMTRIGCLCSSVTHSNPDPAQEQAVDALSRAGHPVVRIDVASPQHLGQEFFRFEIATAVAGAVLGINPFDQPDVEASKIATRAMTDAFEKTGSLPSEPPVCAENGIVLYTDERNASGVARAPARTRLWRAGSRRTWLGLMTTTISRCWLTLTPPQHGRSRCNGCARVCVTGSASQPRCNSGRAFCTRPDRLIRAGRIPACFSKSRPNPIPISTFLDVRRASA